MTRAATHEKARLFTGIPLTEEIRSSIEDVVEELRAEVEGVRWVPPENLHVTLKFLGDYEWSKVPHIKEALEKASKHLPLTIRVGGVGAFPSLGSARVIWVGIKDIEGNVAKVYNILEKGAERGGVPREKRSFRPHITIGRARKVPVKLRRELIEGFNTEWNLEAEVLALFHSELTGKGARYTVVDSVGT